MRSECWVDLGDYRCTYNEKDGDNRRCDKKEIGPLIGG
jgi:hypothetical protein